MQCYVLLMSLILHAVFFFSIPFVHSYNLLYQFVFLFIVLSPHSSVMSLFHFLSLNRLSLVISLSLVPPLVQWLSLSLVINAVSGSEVHEEFHLKMELSTVKAGQSCFLPLF